MRAGALFDIAQPTLSHHLKKLCDAGLVDSERRGLWAYYYVVPASLGCGVPAAVADLHEGETVLDLGSGAGADVLISARRVAPGGRAIGLELTDEMLELTRRNAGRRDDWVRDALAQRSKNGENPSASGGFATVPEEGLEPPTRGL